VHDGKQNGKSRLYESAYSLRFHVSATIRIEIQFFSLRDWQIRWTSYIHYKFILDIQIRVDFFLFSPGWWCFIICKQLFDVEPVSTFFPPQPCYVFCIYEMHVCVMRVARDCEQRTTNSTTCRIVYYVLAHAHANWKFRLSEIRSKTGNSDGGDGRTVAALELGRFRQSYE